MRSSVGAVALVMFTQPVVGPQPLAGNAKAMGRNIHGRKTATLTCYPVGTTSINSDAVRFIHARTRGAVLDDAATNALREMPVAGAACHDVDERVVPKLLEFARKRFGSAWERAADDFGDPLARRQLHLPWSLYGFDVVGKRVAEWFVLKAGNRIHPSWENTVDRPAKEQLVLGARSLATASLPSNAGIEAPPPAACRRTASVPD
jgi:hypothetical protein